MPDLCGAFLHDVDLATELQRRGHQCMFLFIELKRDTNVNGGEWRGFRYMHYSAGGSYMETSDIWICPHSPCLPDVRRINKWSYNRPIIATCHFDGRYDCLVRNHSTSWPEMLLFINRTMEKYYRQNVAPWPPAIKETNVVRPIMHREQIEITEEFAGDCITLVNANNNKGVHQFIKIAERMPNRKFLAVRPYYGELQMPPTPSNVEIVPFADDIREVLKRTKILLFPSQYESFGRIAVEAMLNGIPVIYSKSDGSGKTTEGVEEWITPVGIPVKRDDIDGWISAIESFDSEEAYTICSVKCKEHIEQLDFFTEKVRIADMVEDFSNKNPVIMKTQFQPQSAVSFGVSKTSDVPLSGPALHQQVRQIGFSNGRLRVFR